MCDLLPTNYKLGVRWAAYPIDRIRERQDPRFHFDLEKLVLKN
jgi:hypothetical protein